MPRKRYDPFRGQRAEKLSQMSATEYHSLNIREQAALVSKLASAANKRMKSLVERNIITPERLKYEREGRFGAKGKTKAGLESEFLRLREFFAAPTTTRTATKWLKDFFSRMKEEYPEISGDYEDAGQYVTARASYLYDEYVERLKELGYSSERVRQIIYEYLVDHPFASLEDDMDYFESLISELDSQNASVYHNVWDDPNSVFDIYF